MYISIFQRAFKKLFELVRFASFLRDFYFNLKQYNPDIKSPKNIFFIRGLCMRA